MVNLLASAIITYICNILDDEASMERDRTMGKDSMVNFGMHDSSSEEWPQNSGNNGGNGNKRTCPMCEAAFPPTVTNEDVP